MFWVGWIIFFGVAVSTIPAVIALVLKRLRPSDRVSSEGSLPGVSVVVPARNEGAQVRNALTSILRSQGVRIQLITVDDRSTDDTGAIMDSMAAADSRMKVVHIAELPQGWLGKNYAMHIGSTQATEDLLLFTDGDILFEPMAIETAVQHFCQHQLRHLCLLPKMLPGGFFENVVVTFFGLAFATGMKLHLIRTRWPTSYAGVGAFNMVDASFYRSLGGHTGIAMDVLDDVKLGKLIKKNGGKSDLQMADELLSVRWQTSLWGVVTGLEKNGFASLNYSVTQISFVTFLFFAIIVFPCVAPFVLSFPAASGFLATAVLWHTVYGFLTLQAPGGWKKIPFFLAGAFLMAFAYWRSALITLRQGGVRWRDSFYPLKDLRAAIFR